MNGEFNGAHETIHGCGSLLHPVPRDSKRKRGVHLHLD